MLTQFQPNRQLFYLDEQELKQFIDEDVLAVTTSGTLNEPRILVIQDILYSSQCEVESYLSNYQIERVREKKPTFIKNCIIDIAKSKLTSRTESNANTRYSVTSVDCYKRTLDLLWNIKSGVVTLMDDANNPLPKKSTIKFISWRS